MRHCNVWQDVLTKIILLEEFLQEVCSQDAEYSPVVRSKRQEHLDMIENIKHGDDLAALIEAS